MSSTRALRRTAVSAGLLLSLLGVSAPAAAAQPQPEDDRPSSAAQPAKQRRTPTARDVARARAAGSVRLVATGSSRARAAAKDDVAAERGSLRRSIEVLDALSLEVPAGRAAALTRKLEARGLKVSEVARRSVDDVPNDTYYASFQKTYLDQVHAGAAWDVTHGAASVKIAVVDSGVQVNHPDLASKIAGTYHADLNSTSPSSMTDVDGHGTMVAGTAAAVTNNALGVAGTGRNSSVLAVKVDDEFQDIYTDNVAAGIVWAADNGARVVNLSFGGSQPDQLESNAVAYAQGKGALVVAAAGNDGSNVVQYPAALSNVLAVGATNPATGQRASFSNYGSWVSMAAPGQSIYTTAIGSSYDTTAGTSFSSPLVAGAAALLAGRVPAATAAQLRSALVASAQPLTGQDLGAGLLDMSAAFDQLLPSTVPTITSPAPAATVSGVQGITVTTSAAKVQLSVDSVDVGAPVDPAALSVSTWGLSNGAHTLGVADCNAVGCGDRATVSVNVQNAGPELQPVSGGSATGAQVLTATSSAPFVRFTLDGANPVTVPTGSGSASTTWTTWGLTNATHPVGVANCSSSTVCGPATSTGVPVANATPTITSPGSGATVSGTTTFAGTSAGGGLRFFVDNVSKGFDATAPYSLAFNTSLVANGAHTLKVVQCNTAGTLCAGPSTTRSFTVKSLRPTIISAVSPFSPNGDRRRDVSTWKLRLPENQSVSWRVVNVNGTTITGPTSYKAYPKGDHTFTWTGRSSTSRFSDGTYTILVSTAVPNTVLKGSAARAVRIDTAAPGLSSVIGSNSAVFPHNDGYKDTVRLGVSVSEAATVVLRIRNSGGTVVRTLKTSRSSAGPVAFTWNGRYSNGVAVPAGAYSFFFSANDVAQNYRNTGTYRVNVSAKKLVSKTASYVRDGSQAFEAGAYGEYGDGSYSNCASISQIYTSLYMQNYCEPNDPYLPNIGIAWADYSFTLPSAFSYTSLRMDAYGSGLHRPSDVMGFAYNYGTGKWDSGRALTNNASSDAWLNGLCLPSPSGHISNRQVRVEVALPWGDFGSADYEVVKVRLTVAYKVLA